VGLALGGAAAAAAVAVGARAVRQVGGAERAAALALALAVPVYLLHGLVDIDWDFVSVTAPVAFALGALVAAEGTRARSRRVLTLAPAAVGAAAGVASLVLPWLAEQRVEDAYAALADDPAAAVAAARDADALNPLSPEPLRAQALAEASRGRAREALTLFERAAVRQPKNWETWYDAGVFQLRLGNAEKAYEYLNNAYGLDPFGPAGSPGGPLDEARALLTTRR
jgi:tetratricopeptide (TPR) repeat protein